MKRRPLLLLVLSLLIGLLAGCGGGGKPSGLPDVTAAQTSPAPAPSAVGQARFTVLWPSLIASAHGQAGPRLIPAAANSIVVTLQLGPGQPLTQTLVRPPPVQLPYPGSSIPQPIPTTATFDNLPIGTYTASAVAHPNPDGTGAAQAQASVPLAVAAGQTSPLTMTLGSTIVRVAVAPSPASVTVGQTTGLTATAYDGSGSVVLTSAFVWTSGNTAEASVDPTTGLVTGVAPTPADPPTPVQITATESESGVSGTGAVRVRPNTAAITGVVQDAVSQGTIAGATVVISAGGATVDTVIAGQDNREARFTSRLLPPGTYTLTVSAPNYQPNSVTVTLLPAQNLDAGIILLRSTVGRILGTVTDGNTRAGISGATVTLTPTAGGGDVTVTADAVGSFNNGLIPVGSYRLFASAPGYATSASRTVTITSSGATDGSTALLPPTSPIR